MNHTGLTVGEQREKLVTHKVVVWLVMEDGWDIG